MKTFFRRLYISILSLVFLSVPLHGSVSAFSKPQKNEKYSDSTLHIKFKETDEIDLNNDQFISKNGKDLKKVNNALSATSIKKKSRLFDTKPEEIRKNRSVLRNNHSQKYIPDLNNYYRLELREGENIEKTIAELKKLPEVSEVYPEPLPTPAPTAPSYTALQSHFIAAPAGMGITEASSLLPGALGDRIKIADLEYSWNYDHEDIEKSRHSDTVLTTGTPVDPFNNNNHGTAVAGLISGDRNGFGINGIISDAKLHLVHTNTLERGWDIPNAIYTANASLSAGDVMLIQQQTWGPDGRGFLPVEWIPAVYDVIKISTLSGIIVVQAAGNGGENLDDPVFGSTFPHGKPNSGSIIVGAGRACDNTTKRSRLVYSNYGSRVNVQGFGECVVTTGYGSLNYGAGANGWYTNNFSGTSAATALVASVAGSISSSYIAQTNNPLSPEQVRNLIINTGTEQDSRINPGNIGPLPNLEAALNSFLVNTPKDNTVNVAPPDKLRAIIIRESAVFLRWNAPKDIRRTAIYRIYRDNELIATTTNLRFIDTLTNSSTTYQYTIQIVDLSTNAESELSKAVLAKTR